MGTLKRTNCARCEHCKWWALDPFKDTIKWTCKLNEREFRQKLKPAKKEGGNLLEVLKNMQGRWKSIPDWCPENN